MYKFPKAGDIGNSITNSCYTLQNVSTRSNAIKPIFLYTLSLLY